VKVLVTGASGFVGQVLVRRLLAAGHEVRRALRAPGPDSTTETVVVGSFSVDTDWRRALDGVDAVAHLAARAHVSGPDAADEAAFMAVNHDATLALARACAGRVRRFVFVSTIGVHGAISDAAGFNEDSALRPHTPYARSKVRAETALRELARDDGLSLAILRPPLVYGPGAPGNLARLVAAVRRGWPLPLAAVNNARSLIGVEHLTGIIEAALGATMLSREVFCVADRERLSTPDMVRAIASGLDRPARLFSVPPGVLQLLGRLSGRAAQVQQLTGSLVVNATAARAAFGDLQARPLREGLMEMAVCG